MIKAAIDRERVARLFVIIMFVLRIHVQVNDSLVMSGLSERVYEKKIT